MINQSAKAHKPSKFFSFLLVAAMAIDVYLIPFFPSLSFGELIVMVVGVVLLLKHGILYPPKAFALFWLFLLYSLVISVFSALIIDNSSRDIFVRLLRDGVYWFIILFFCNSLVDFKVFIKWIVVLCVVLSLFLLLQTIVFYITGYFIPGFYLDALVNDNQYYGYQIYNHILTTASYSYFRPNGFLCEPANCAQVLLIGLIILFNVKYRFRFIYAFLFSTAMLLTLSASAFVYLAVAWIIYFFLNRKNIVRNISIIFSLLLIAVLVTSLFNASDFGFVLSRLTRVASGDGSEDYSSFLRLFRGFEDWSKLPLFSKLFGAGFGSWDAANKLYSFSTDQVNEYMNTLSYILFSTGIPGFILFLSALFVFFKNGNSITKSMIIGLLLISSCSSVYSTFVFIWAMAIITMSANFRVEYLEKRVNAKPQYI